MIDDFHSPGNTWKDVFWGVDKNTGVGRNFLGRILMHIRQEIRDNMQPVK